MKRVVGHILCLLVGGYFLMAGATKLIDPVAFFQSILNYQLVGEDLAWLAALYLPFLEIVAALALIIPRTRLAGLVWLAALLLVFQAALASAWVRGLDIDCGCVGSGGSSVLFALVRNTVLLVMLAGVAFAGALRQCKRS